MRTTHKAIFARGITTPTDLAARLAHLRGVVLKENHYLAYTVGGLKQADPQFRWPDAIEQNADLTEPVGTVLDNLNRAEKLGLIPSVADWNKNPRSKLRGMSMSFRAQRGILSKIPHFVRDDNKRSTKSRRVPSLALFQASCGESVARAPNPEEIEARTLRNNLVHEYTEVVDMLRQSLLRALELIPMLEAVTQKFCQESKK